MERINGLEDTADYLYRRSWLLTDYVHDMGNHLPDITADCEEFDHQVEEFTALITQADTIVREIEHDCDSIKKRIGWLRKTLNSLKEKHDDHWLN